MKTLAEEILARQCPLVGGKFDEAGTAYRNGFTAGYEEARREFAEMAREATKKPASDFIIAQGRRCQIEEDPIDGGYYVVERLTGDYLTRKGQWHRSVEFPLMGARFEDETKALSFAKSLAQPGGSAEG